MKKIFFSTIILASILYAGGGKEMVLGKTKDFAERDMIELIQEFIEKNKAQIEQKAFKTREQARENVKNYQPKGLLPLKPALEDKIFYPDLTYTLDQDIKNANGDILYPKGFQFNPADYVKLSYAMVVINGNNKKEVEWFEKSGFSNQVSYRLLLSEGSYYDLNQELKQEVFYLNPQIREKFKIEKTPSIIKQIDNKIQIHKIYIPCMENNKTKIIDNNLSKKEI